MLENFLNNNQIEFFSDIFQRIVQLFFCYADKLNFFILSVNMPGIMKGEIGNIGQIPFSLDMVKKGSIREKLYQLPVGITLPCCFLNALRKLFSTSLGSKILLFLSNAIILK